MLWRLLVSACLILQVMSASPSDLDQLATPTTTTTASPEPTPSTIVDILSSQAQYSYFLRHLQRHGMIPILNQLQNVTLLAPVNSAFTFNETDVKLDNNELLRYVVNQRFRVGYLTRDTVVYDTLYEFSNGSYYEVSVSPDFDTSEYIVDGISTIVEPDIYAKHQYSFIQGMEKLLPMKQSLCEVLLGDDLVNGEQISFIQTLFKQLFPQKLGTTKKHQKRNLDKKKKKPNKIALPQTCGEFLKNTKTLLLPTDEMVKSSLPDLTFSYFTNILDQEITAKDAIQEIRGDIVNLLSSIMLQDIVGGTNGTLNRTHKTANKHSFNISLVDNHILVNGSVKSSSLSVVADGLVHLFSPQPNVNFFTDLNVVVPEMIPRRALYALRYTNFVNELKFRSLDYLIDGSTSNQTIFVSVDQNDDVSQDDIYIEDWLHMDSFNSKQGLLYQFTQEYINIQNSISHKPVLHKLLDSKLCIKKKIGGCYKVKLSASKDSHGEIKLTINDDVDTYSHVGIEAGNNSIIYISNKDISTPPNFKHSLGDLISNGAIQRHLENIQIDKDSCLATIGYLNTYGLFSLADNSKGYSVFLPCGEKESLTKKAETEFQSLLTLQNSNRGTWGDLGLVLKYLEAHPKLFRDILKGMFVEDLVYSDFGSNRTMVSKSLRGDSVFFEDVSFDEDKSNQVINLNRTALTLPLNSDILFNQGVLHVIDRVLMPEYFQIPFIDLLKTTLDSGNPGFSIIDLMSQIPALHHLLTGHDPKAEKYSLLVPTAESLRNFNITSSFSDLARFFQLHLIPNDQVGKLLECTGSDFYNPSFNLANDTSGSISTNLSDTAMRCYRQPDNGKTYLKLYKTDEGSQEMGGPLSYNKDHEVRLLSHGCTTFNFNPQDESCVFLIEKPLSLEWLNDRGGDNFLHIHLGFVSVGVGVILGLILFGGVLMGAVICLGSSSKKHEHSPSRENPFVFPDQGSSFMRVTSDDELQPSAYDRGYETDVDVLRSESDQLLPANGKKYRRRGYGSVNGTFQAIAPSSVRTAPLSIKSTNVTKGLNRDRNIPGY